MKKSILLLALHVFTFNIVLAQVPYVNLNNTVSNSASKSGWTLVFQDEFSTSNTLNYNWNKNIIDGTNDFEGYRWGNTQPLSSSYNTNRTAGNYNIDISSSGSVKLIARKNTENWKPAIGPYYGNKPYTSTLLNTDDCAGTTNQVTNHLWKYGYFEMRCKNPKGRYMWPSFWLFGEPNSNSSWNEIDIFEFGSGDQIVMTNHYQTGSHVTSANWIYSLPGQTFGETWVTYALKWEPNKLVWYINNIPVRVVSGDATIKIPDVAMRVKIGPGVEVGPKFDWNLSATFPNTMEIDYVRIFQRSDHTVPDPIFTIEKQQSFSPSSPIAVKYASSKPILLDGSQSYMPSHAYFLSVQECDGSGNLIGNEAYDWLNSTEVANIDKLDIKAFAQNSQNNGGLTMASGKKYRIKLAGSSPWTEVSQYISLSTCSNSVSFKINGQSQLTWPNAITIYPNAFKPKIIVDATGVSSCDNGYFISVQECNSSGTVSGTELTHWFSQSEIDSLSNFNVDRLCSTNSFALTAGHYYKIKLAVNNSWTESAQVIYIPSCTVSPSFTINELTGSSVDIENGQDIIVDASASTFCENAYFVSVRECNSSGTTFYGTEISEWKTYANYYYGGYYTYDIGRYDIRDLCARNSFALQCSKYYSIKIAGNPWVSLSKTIYIKPCTAVNNNFDIKSINYDSNDYWGLSDCYPANECATYQNRTLEIFAPNSVSCDNRYYVAIQKSVNGTLTGTEAWKWLNQDEITQVRVSGGYDLIPLAMDPDGNESQSDNILATPGTYRVSFAASGGTSCFSHTWSDIVRYKTVIFGAGTEPPTIIDEKESIVANDILIHPNPAKDNFIVQLPYSENAITLTLLDIQGRVLQTIQTQQGTETINTSELASGYYILQGLYTDRIITKRVQVIKD